MPSSFLWIPENFISEIKGLDMDHSKILRFIDNEHSPIIVFDTEYNDAFFVPLLDSKNPFIL